MNPTPAASLSRLRWSLFGILALSYILVYFYRVSLAVVADDLSRELSLTPQQLGTLSGILFYVYAVAQLPLGPLIDRYGGRLVISGCGILTALGGLLFSQAQSLQTAMAARILIGIGTAAVLMATFAIFSHWYTRQEFGRVSGLMVAVGNLGNLAGTAPLALAVAAIGWRSSFLTIGVLQGVATLLVFLLVRDTPPAAVEERPAAEEPAARPGFFSAWGEIFGRRDFLLLAGLAYSWYGCYLAVQGLWGGPYLMGVFHFSREVTGQLLMFTSLGFIVGSFFSDRLARQVFGSHKRTLIAGQAGLLVLMSAFLGWAELLSPPLLALYFFALGLVVSTGVMIYPIIRAMFAVRIVGTALTSLNFFVLLGAAVTQHLMGLILGRAGGGTTSASAYHLAFLLPLCCLAVTLGLYTLARDYTLAERR